MCHPGFVDDTLVGLDPLTDQREHEHAFLGGRAISRSCWPRTKLHWALIIRVKFRRDRPLSHTEI